MGLAGSDPLYRLTAARGDETVQARLALLGIRN
jgi:hypothetical protein